LVTDCFNSFFEHQVIKYTDSKKYKVHTVGSIGFVYQKLFEKVAKKHGYSVGSVIKSPMDGLIDYHLQN
jgi:glucosamine kinase